MSFFAVGSGIAVAAGATAGGLVATGVGAAAAIGGSMAVSKLAGGSKSGGNLPYNALDVNQVITDARTSAAENYKNSLNLEQQYNPQQAAFRAASTSAAAKLAGDPTAGAANYAGTSTGSLLSESADSILSQLRLGSALPVDVQNQIMRASLSNGGQAGLEGSFAQRGLTAQDIGLNSLSLLQQRQQAAQQAGLSLAQLQLQQSQLASSNTLGLKTLADSFSLPESGLDSGSIASLYIGNNNAANQVAQNQAIINQQNANVRSANLSKMLGFASQASGLTTGSVASGITGLFGGTGAAGAYGTSNPYPV